MALKSPLNVHWEMTNVCNLRCLHCYQQDDGPRKGLPNDSTLFTIARRIAEAAIFELTITGGEPLLVPHLPALIKYFNDHAIRPHITSNGMLVNDAAADWIAAADVTFQVSIDSADPTVHNEIRQSQVALDRAVAGVRLLVERGVEVSLAYTSTRSNLDDLDGVVNLADDLGVSKVCVGEVLPYFGTEENRDGLRPHQAGFETFVRHLSDVRRTYEGRVDVVAALMSGHLYDTSTRNSPCTALDRDLAILHDGWAYPCPFVRSFKYRLGNVLDHPISAIWNGDTARAFRAEKREGSPKHCTIPNSGPVPVQILARRT